MRNLVGHQLGNYKLLHLLGYGSHSHVYLGEDKYKRSPVAVKVLNSEITQGLTERWLAEIHMLSHLSHPHVVQMREFGTQGDVQFLVMDWAEMGTLLDLFAQSVPIGTVTIYIEQIVSALQYLHSMHIVHRDIKPQNILVKSDGCIWLADFELAVDYGDCQSASGTTAYAAPEQMQGRPCPASDQYALGVLVYQWLSGERPFYGASTEVLTQHQNTPPLLLRDKVPPIPPAVEQVVLTALAKDPESRFASVREFVEVLKEACQFSSYWTLSPILETGGGTVSDQDTK